jgi:SAM-dependent methyltransferase
MLEGYERRARRCAISGGYDRAVEGPQGDELDQTAYFGGLRDFWWNADHLELCARRIGLEHVRTVLDVGSGVGHWGRLLAQVMPAQVTVIGVDREPRWVEEATRRASEAGLDDRFSYRTGNAQELPFEDESFDLVTCQTLLIHLPEPRAAIREMARVVKRGGLVLASEPNNHAVTLSETSINATAPVEERGDQVSFYLTCERGQIALGEGNLSIGDLVPGYLMDEGFDEIQAYMSDKALLMLPPYSSPDQQFARQAYAEEAEHGGWGWSREQTLRYYTAGGGSEAEFPAAWERRMAEHRAVVDAIDNGTFNSAGGHIQYLVAGRRPPP